MIKWLIIAICLEFIFLCAIINALAGWQSGYAADCKSVDAGSIPTSASIFFEATYIKSLFCFVVELLDNFQEINL